MTRFKDRVAVVTGGGGGIGLAVARGLLEEGARVGVMDVKPMPEEFAPHGDGLRYGLVDLSDADAVSSFIEEVVATFGPPNHLVNVAGIAQWGRDGSIIDMPLEYYRKTLDVNLDGVVSVIRNVIPHMRKASARSMVHVASVVGLRSMDNAMKDGPLDAYQISKAAVVSLSRSLAVSLGKEGIRSNTVCPGSIWTPMTDAIYADPERVRTMAERTPIARVGQPEDVAAACLFLLSDDAAFITGIDLPVDGGLLAKLV